MEWRETRRKENTMLRGGKKKDITTLWKKRRYLVREMAWSLSSLFCVDSCSPIAGEAWVSKGMCIAHLPHIWTWSPFCVWVDPLNFLLNKVRFLLFFPLLNACCLAKLHYLLIWITSSGLKQRKLLLLWKPFVQWNVILVWTHPTYLPMATQCQGAEMSRYIWRFYGILSLVTKI